MQAASLNEVNQGMSGSSGRWLSRQKRDPFVREARADGYRSRAAFKLIELDQRFRLFKPRAVVLDLGAAPGSWSQVAQQRVGPTGVVIACDLLEIPSLCGNGQLPDVNIMTGDVRDLEVQERIVAACGARALDLVISDMAPNLSGVRARDQAEAIGLADTTLEICAALLRKDGQLVVKLFQGEGSQAWITEARQRFAAVRIVKPKASRDESREVYVVASGHVGMCVQEISVA